MEENTIDPRLRGDDAERERKEFAEQKGLRDAAPNQRAGKRQLTMIFSFLIEKLLSLHGDFWNGAMATTMEKERATRRTDIASRTNLKAVILSDKVLTDFISGRNNKSLKELRGKINFRDDYDYKLMRS